MTDRSDAEQIARNASMAHHPASGVDLTGLDEFRADLPPLVPMSSAVMADAQAQIAGMDRDYCIEPVQIEPQPMADAKHWRALCEARATIKAQQVSLDARESGANELGKALRDAEFRTANVLAGRAIEQTMIRNAVARLARVEALIATWHKSPDMRTRAHADRLSEAFDGRPRA